MSGIYGDSLLAWPEQQQALTVYDMAPEVNGGYNLVPGTMRVIIGIIQNTTGKQIKDSNGNLVAGNGQELWTSESNLDGIFLNYEDDVYRIKTSNNWKFEGGFKKYSLEKVVGNNGTEHDDAAWNTGGNSFC